MNFYTSSLLMITLIFFLSNHVYAQEIKFTITDAQVYVNNDFNSAETNKVRNMAVGENLIIEFFSNSPLVKLSIPTDNQEVILEKERSNVYINKTEDELFRLEFQRFVRYIRGGELEVTFNHTDEKLVLIFSRS